MGDEAPTSDPNVPTLPFKPPELDWSSPNLYSQFKLFWASVIMLSKALTVVTPKRPKLVPFSIGSEVVLMRYIPILIGLTLVTKMIQISSLLSLRSISSLHITNITLCTPWVPSIPVSLNANLNS